VEWTVQPAAVGGVAFDHPGDSRALEDKQRGLQVRGVAGAGWVGWRVVVRDDEEAGERVAGARRKRVGCVTKRSATAANPAPSRSMDRTNPLFRQPRLLGRVVTGSTLSQKVCSTSRFATQFFVEGSIAPSGYDLYDGAQHRQYIGSRPWADHLPGGPR
jgi:hypothetical protein